MANNERTTSPAQLLTRLADERAGLLAAAALVPAEERASRPVCGEWTVKDVLGHVADWEWLGVEALRQMAAGRAPQVGHVEDIDAWNHIHVEARRAQSWEEVWTDFQAARQAFVEVLETMSQATLERSFPSPWGSDITPYRWVCIYLDHDREHAEGLERAINEGGL